MRLSVFFWGGGTRMYEMCCQEGQTMYEERLVGRGEVGAGVRSQFRV